MMMMTSTLKAMTSDGLQQHGNYTIDPCETNGSGNSHTSTLCTLNLKLWKVAQNNMILAQLSWVD